MEQQILERQRTVECANLELQKGKQAFAARDSKAAVGHLTRANVHYRCTKLAIVIVLLRLAPGFVQVLSYLRNRFIYRQ